MFVCCVKLAELMISISRTTLIFFQPVQLDVRSCVLSSSRTCISVLCQNSWKGRAYLWGGGGGDWISYSLFGNSSSVLGREEGGLGSGFCVCLLYVCVCACAYLCVFVVISVRVSTRNWESEERKRKERERVSALFLGFFGSFHVGAGEGKSKCQRTEDIDEKVSQRERWERSKAVR